MVKNASLWSARRFGHVAVLADPANFDSLHRRDNFFEDGVHTVFGIKDDTADLQAFYFQTGHFTMAQAKQWLAEQGFQPLFVLEATPDEGAELACCKGTWSTDDF